MLAAFRLYNKETRRDLNIFVSGWILPFCDEPTYLGIKLDRTLTFRQHLESLRKNLTSRIGLLKRLARSSWGANPTVLRRATLAFHSTAKYCTPVWCLSNHTRLINKPSNDALRIVIGCLRLTPTDNLSILSGIQPSFASKKPYCL